VSSSHANARLAWCPRAHPRGEARVGHEFGAEHFVSVRERDEQPGQTNAICLAETLDLTPVDEPDAAVVE
jgi:hypothetical protein